MELEEVGGWRDLEKEPKKIKIPEKTRAGRGDHDRGGEEGKGQVKSTKSVKVIKESVLESGTILVEEGAESRDDAGDEVGKRPTA